LARVVSNFAPDAASLLAIVIVLAALPAGARPYVEKADDFSSTGSYEILRHQAKHVPLTVVEIGAAPID
jgi:hypothetical protein